MTDSTQADRREMSILEKLSIPESQSPPWSAIEAIIVLFGFLLALMLIGPAIASIIMGETPSPILFLLGWTIGEAIAIPFILINRRSSQASWQAMQLNHTGLPAPFLLLVGVALAITVDVIVGIGSGQFVIIPVLYGFQIQGVFGILLAGLFVVLIQPIAETLVFQGILLPKMRYVLGSWLGVFLCTVLYTLIHYGIFYLAYADVYPAQTMLWYGVMLPFLSGLIFCLIRVYTNSTRAVMIARIGAGLIFLMTSLVLVT